MSVVDGIKLLLPFVAMPYIIRVCGVENYGKIIFSQAVMAYFSIVVNFGLNIFTVKEVAHNSGDLSAISRIASSFITLRLLLITICFAVLGGMILFVSFMQPFKLLMLYAFIAVFSGLCSEGVSVEELRQTVSREQHRLALNNHCISFTKRQLLKVAFYSTPMAKLCVMAMLRLRNNLRSL